MHVHACTYTDKHVHFVPVHVPAYVTVALLGVWARGGGGGGRGGIEVGSCRINQNGAATGLLGWRIGASHAHRSSSTPITTQRYFGDMTGMAIAHKGSQVKAAELQRLTLSCRKATRRGCRLRVEEAVLMRMTTTRVDIVE